MKMTLARKLILSYLLIISVSALITLIATVRFHNLNTFTLSITSEAVPALLQEKKIERSFEQIQDVVRKYRVIPGSEFREYFFRKIHEARAMIDSLKSMVSADIEKEILGDMLKELDIYQELFKLQMNMPVMNDNSTGEKIRKSEVRFRELVSKLTLETEKILNAQLKRSEKMGVKTSKFLWILFGFTIVSMTAMILFFVYNLTYSFRRLQRGVRKISDGNFDLELSIPQDDEMGELTAEFNAMVRKLKDLEDMKTHFMAMVLHDLKGPITAMKGAVSLLLEKKNSMHAKQQEFLELVSHETEHLNRLVDDLNEVSRIDSGVFKILRKSFNLQKLVGEVVIGMQSVLAEANQKIELLVDSRVPEINGDGDRIKQVFVNLITNASRFSPPDGVIRVSIEAKSDRVYCQVADSGPGISAEHGKHIFEKFYQGSAAGSKRIGSGLGLYIVKKIIDHHGGRIWFQSAEGKGSTFYFSIPYS